MGGIVALASVVVLGDGSLAASEADPAAPRAPRPAPRPAIVAIVAESVPAELTTVVARRLDARLPGPVRALVARRLLAAAAARLGGDPCATEPIRVVALVAPVPLLLVNGDADPAVPVLDGRRLATLAGPTAQLWVVPGADHSRAHGTDPTGWETRVTAFLRRSFTVARAAPDDAGILAAARPATLSGGEPGAVEPTHGG
jgi:fermentation-respiration switch protein FrsA (DUF1100 family)